MAAMSDGVCLLFWSDTRHGNIGCELYSPTFRGPIVCPGAIQEEKLHRCLSTKFIYFPRAPLLIREAYAAHDALESHVVMTLSLVNSDGLVDRSLVRARWEVLSKTAEVHVGLEAPVLRNVELLPDGYLSFSEHGHVLQVGTQAFEFKSSPDLNLGHGVRMLRPLREHVSSGLVRLLRLLDYCTVLPEENL